MPESDINNRARNWVFTLNNWTQTDINLLNESNERFLGQKIKPLHYMFKKEIAPTTGTKHLQGHICFVEQARGTTVKKWFTNLGGSWKTCHFLVMRGKVSQSETYIRKAETADPDDATIYEWGTKPKDQGARNDLDDLHTAIFEGKSELECFETDPGNYLKYSAGVKRGIALVNSQIKRRWQTRVYWFYGPTASGKSRLAHILGGEGAYHKCPSEKWWDGYSSETHVIIDDFRPNMCTFSDLLRLFDRYPLQLQVKFASAMFAAETIYVTSAQPPQRLWPNQPEEKIDQLLRRLTDIVYFERGETPISLKTRLPFETPGPFDKDWDLGLIDINPVPEGYRQLLGNYIEPDHDEQQNFQFVRR